MYKVITPPYYNGDDVMQIIERQSSLRAIPADLDLIYRRSEMQLTHSFDRLVFEENGIISIDCWCFNCLNGTSTQEHIE